MSKSIPAGTMKRTIAYYYLLSYCPPAMIAEFKVSTEALRKDLAKEAGMNQRTFFKHATPDVCRHIVSFHEGTREPSAEFVEPLLAVALQAQDSPEAAAAFQAEMSKVARLQPRAAPENRLHRKKGCAYCRMPCHYGYFTLVSDPDFRLLQGWLEIEAQRPQQQVTQPVWLFAIQHLSLLTASRKIYVQIEHLGNLAFCLLMLSMAKSRLPLPEEQIKVFQAANQALIQSGQPARD